MKRTWNGLHVEALHNEVASMGDPRDRRVIEVNLTEEAARQLALSIRRMQQSFQDVLPAVQELSDALDHLLVGDPGSRGSFARLRNEMQQRGELPGQPIKPDWRSKPVREPGQGDDPQGEWNAGKSGG